MVDFPRRDRRWAAYGICNDHVPPSANVRRSCLSLSRNPFFSEPSSSLVRPRLKSRVNSVSAFREFTIYGGPPEELDYDEPLYLALKKNLGAMDKGGRTPSSGARRLEATPLHQLQLQGAVHTRR